MSAVEWFRGGGPIMPVLLVLGVVLYTVLIERLIALYGPSAQADGAVSLDTNRRGLLLLRALVAAAPLLGLLGTVSGMISSFEALVGAGRIDQIGAGISYALRTTQYGLAIAVPGVVLERMISHRSLALEKRLEAAS